MKQNIRFNICVINTSGTHCTILSSDFVQLLPVSLFWQPCGTHLERPITIFIKHLHWLDYVNSQTQLFVEQIAEKRKKVTKCLSHISVPVCIGS